MKSNARMTAPRLSFLHGTTTLLTNIQQKIIDGAVASRRRGWVWRYGVGLMAFAAALAIRQLFQPALLDRLPYIIFFGAIAFTVWFCGTRPAILVIFAGGLASELFFIHPAGAFSWSTPPFLIGRISYLLTSTVILLLGHLAAVSEKTLAQQRIQLEIAQEAATAGFYEWEIKQDFANWSPALRSIYGVTSEVPPTLDSWSQLLHPEDREKAMEAVLAIRESDADEFENIHRIITPVGEEKCLLSRGIVSRDAQGRALRVIGLAIDITRQRTIEEGLLRSAKLLAATRMASTVAHEVNNPLQAVLSLLFLIRTDSTLPARTVEIARAAEDEVRRVAALAQRSVSFFHDPKTVQALDLCQVVSDVVDLHRNEAERAGIHVRTSAEQHYTVLFSLTELRQLLSNLVHNSVEAMKDAGGTLTVSCNSREGWVELIVEDTGPGIEQCHLEKIFEPFFTTKPAIGTGLGLWVSRSIVESNGGTLTVQTDTARDRHGSRFLVKLPLASRSASATKTSKSASL